MPIVNIKRQPLRVSNTTVTVSDIQCILMNYRFHFLCFCKCTAQHFKILTLSGNWDWIKILTSLDQKADSNIVQLGLMRVAVVFLFFYILVLLYFSLFLPLISIDHKASIPLIYTFKAWLVIWSFLVSSGPKCVSARSRRVNLSIQRRLMTKYE